MSLSHVVHGDDVEVIPILTPGMKRCERQSCRSLVPILELQFVTNGEDSSDRTQICKSCLAYYVNKQGTTVQTPQPPVTTSAGFSS